MAHTYLATLVIFDSSKIRTVDNHPSVQAVTRITAILNPVTPFTIENNNSNSVDRTENKRDGKHEERRQNHRHQYMVWAASKLGEKGPLG